MEQLQKRPIRLLVVEDTRADAERAAHQFTRAGVPWELRRVETAEALRSALAEFSPTLILSDFTLPRFDGMSALEICREQAPDVPFIFLSGTIGEERAISALKAGAADYVLKENMARLVPAAQRAISDAAARDEKRRQQTQWPRWQGPKQAVQLSKPWLPAEWTRRRSRNWSAARRAPWPMPPAWSVACWPLATSASATTPPTSTVGNVSDRCCWTMVCARW